MSKKVEELERAFNEYFTKRCTPGLNFVKVTLKDPIQLGDIHYLSKLGNHYKGVDIGIKRSGKGLTVIATV